MIRKGISLITAAAILYVYLQSLLRYEDALFLITSSNLLVNIGLLVLGGVMVWVSFQNRFASWQSYLATVGLAVGLGLFSLLGLFFTSSYSSIFSTIQLMDYMILLEAGIVFGICALTYEHEPVPDKLKSYGLPQFAKLKRQFSAPALPQPLVNSTTGKSRPQAA